MGLVRLRAGADDTSTIGVDIEVRGSGSIDMRDSFEAHTRISLGLLGQDLREGESPLSHVPLRLMIMCA